MKVSRKVLPVFAAILASQSFGQTVREAIQHHYDQISRLVIKKNSAELGKTLRKSATSGFQYIDALENTMDISATVRQNVDQLSSVAKFNSNSNRIIGSKQVGYDTVFTVKTAYDAYVTIKGQKSRIQGVSISEDTWTKTIMGWKVKKSKTIKESILKDGKPMKV